MKIVALLSLLTAALSAMGCGRNAVQYSDNRNQQQFESQLPAQEKEQLKAVADSGEWFKDVNQKDVAERDAALQQAPDREKALAMEVSAMNETFKKRIEMSRQAKSRRLPVEQIIRLNEDIVTKSEEAKSKMRLSHYQRVFQPRW